MRKMNGIKNQSIRIICFAIIFAMVTVTIPHSVLKAASYSSGDYIYYLRGNNAVIESYIGSGGVVNVPRTLDGHPVVEIGEYAFDFRTNVVEIILPDSVTRIGRSAIQFCLGLHKITIPAGVLSIDDYAFNTTPLKVIDFKGPLFYPTYIAFLNCYPEQIYVPLGSASAYRSRFTSAGLTSYASAVLEKLPLSGYEVRYEPNKWNDAGNIGYNPGSPYIQHQTNCYAYALNLQRHPITDVAFPLPGYSGYCLQPGELALDAGLSGVDTSKNVVSGGAQTVINCQKDAQAIGGTFTSTSRTAVCPPGTYKVALVIDPGWDYHWYRQNSDATWSHKPGVTPVKNVDDSNKGIVDPQSANRGRYTQFIGYYAVQPKSGGMYSLGIKKSQIAKDTPMKKKVNSEVLKIDKDNSKKSSNQISFLKKGMLVDDVVNKIGYPQEVVGSGFRIVSYTLKNGDTLLVNYGATGESVYKACTVDQDGKRTFIVE